MVQVLNFLKGLITFLLLDNMVWKVIANNILLWQKRFEN
jgi:hypothetical protein